jgi:hypothetical protein
MLMRNVLATCVYVVAFVSGVVPAGARVTVTPLRASVGLNSIRLDDGSGRPVRKLPAGVYRIVVADRSSRRNFHLAGPTGTVNRSTTLRFVGTQVWTLRLAQGAYAFYSEAGRSLRGAFTVR